MKTDELIERLGQTSEPVSRLRPPSTRAALWFAMGLMLRHGAPLTPHLSTALGGLAAAGLGNFGLRLFHPQDASIMVLVWQMGTVFVLTALAGWAGGLLLDWRSLLEAARRQVGYR